jgi:hypothetical protein
MKTQLLMLMALAGASAFAQPRFSIGVNIGGYPGYSFAAPLPPFWCPWMLPCDWVSHPVGAYPGTGRRPCVQQVRQLNPRE